jgi:uncharacterized protein YbjQ (UPF0145 family)
VTTDPAPAVWTSDLSVAEAAAVRRVGLVPLGFVMGTTVMQLASAGGQVTGGMLMSSPFGGSSGGYQPYPCAHGLGYMAGSMEHFGFNLEDTVLEDALLEGYRTAIDRLGAEAAELGAHGVVGVEIFDENLVGSLGAATFFARGTAVVHRGSEPLATPFLTNASGQHFERLVALGYVPAGLAVGIGALFVRPNCQSRGDVTVVGPLRQIPQAIGGARARARAALAADAHQRGEGVVHTQWSDRRVNRYGESWNQLTVAIGTAVRRYHRQPEPSAPRPVLPLRP